MATPVVRSGKVVCTLGEIAGRFALRLSDPASAAVPVSGMATLQSAKVGQISFLANPHYRRLLPDTAASAVILRERDAEECPVPCLYAENPYLAYAQVSALFDTSPAMPAGIHPTAVVDATAEVAADVAIGPHCVIGAHVRIGAGAIIHAGSCVGEGSVIGERTVLHANVTVYHGVVIGDDGNIHSGAVIGSDGFGFAPEAAGWRKIHQLGGVVIGNRVEIGANTCIDRGALDDTVIGDGVIIDNLVQIAHNVRIGNNTAIAACTGIAGSTEIGQNCTIAGAVGIVGHLKIADRVHVTAKSLVTGSIQEPGSYSSGTALSPTAAWRRSAVRFSQLDSLFQRVRALESRQSDN